jgi:hypothetical protein
MEEGNLMDDLREGRLNNKPEELHKLLDQLDLTIVEAKQRKDTMKQFTAALAKAHVKGLLMDLEPKPKTWFQRLFC